MSIKKTWDEANLRKRTVMVLGAVAALILAIALIVGCSPTKPFVATQSAQAEKDFKAALVAKGYPSNISIRWDGEHYEATTRVRSCDVELDQTGQHTFEVDELGGEEVTKKKLGQSPANISRSDLDKKLGQSTAKNKFRCV